MVIFRIVFGIEPFFFSFRIINNYDFKRIQDSHHTRGIFIKVFTDAEF